MVITSQNLWHIKQVITSTLSNDSVNCILQNKKLIEIFFYRGLYFHNRRIFCRVEIISCLKEDGNIGAVDQGATPCLQLRSAKILKWAESSSAPLRPSYFLSS